MTLDIVDILIAALLVLSFVVAAGGGIGLGLEYLAIALLVTIWRQTKPPAGPKQS